MIVSTTETHIEIRFSKSCNAAVLADRMKVQHRIRIAYKLESDSLGKKWYTFRISKEQYHRLSPQARLDLVAGLDRHTGI